MIPPRSGLRMISPGPAHFATTRWSLVVAAQDGDAEHTRSALAALCEEYRVPMRACMRPWSHTADQARDLTRGFFARFSEPEFLLRDADQSRGRFRYLLYAACAHFLSTQQHRCLIRERRRGDSLVLIGSSH